MLTSTIRTFTMLLQNDQGGLELRDPNSKEFLHAVPEEGTLVLNVGDMLQRFTNGLLTFFPLLHPYEPYPYAHGLNRGYHLSYMRLTADCRLLHLGAASGVGS